MSTGTGAQASEFRRELAGLINRYSRENGSDTPDFILAEYLDGCLRVFDGTLQRREKWYGRQGLSCSPPSTKP